MTTSQSVSRRRWLILAGAIVAILVAVAVPWLRHDSSANRSGGPGPRLAANLHVSARIDGAEQVMATRSAPASADPTAAEGAARADTALGIELLQRLKGSAGRNLSVSPMSLALALAMLENGAGGKTLTGIQAALHATGIDARTLAAGWSALVQDWASAAKSSGFSLHSANSLWLSPDLKTRAGFMSALANYFDTGVWRVDFTRPGAADAINKWTSQETEGKITKLFDRLDPATRAVLANAVYFKAAWAQPFEPSDTHPGSFAGAGGPTPASFMSVLTTVPCAITSGYQAVQLPYQGGRFAALAIMPTGGSLDDYVQGLDATSLQAVIGGLTPTGVQVGLPKFTTTSALTLNSPLAAMGMSDAFSGDADFSALSPEGLQVSQVVQRVYLKVAEKGTEAAAATGVGMTATAARAAPTAITFDHPFLFLIRDTKTGAILFASEIQHPTA